VLNWFANRGGGSCWITCEPNPYLPIPVILDEYVKNRDIWSCPSGGLFNSFAISPCLPDWWTRFLNSPDLQRSRHICMSPYPPGWGGYVTDTATQYMCGGGGDVAGGNSSAGGSFGTNYASPYGNCDQKTSQMEDAAKLTVASSSGAVPGSNVGASEPSSTPCGPTSRTQTLPPAPFVSAAAAATPEPTPRRQDLSEKTRKELSALGYTK
jgi:hypothetical protein